MGIGNRELRRKLSGLWIFFALLVAGNLGAANEASTGYEWGPEVGSMAPVELQAQDQTGTQRSVHDLAGDNGLLLFFVRSADW